MFQILFSDTIIMIILLLVIDIRFLNMRFSNQENTFWRVHDDKIPQIHTAESKRRLLAQSLRFLAKDERFSAQNVNLEHWWLTKSVKKDIKFNYLV